MLFYEYLNVTVQFVQFRTQLKKEGNYSQCCEETAKADFKFVTLFKKSSWYFVHMKLNGMIMNAVMDIMKCQVVGMYH